MAGNLIKPLQLQGQLTEVSNKCNPCPSDQDYRYPELLNLKPAEPAPVCRLDASRTASQWLSEVVAAPTCVVKQISGMLQKKYCII